MKYQIFTTVNNDLNNLRLFSKESFSSYDDAKLKKDYYDFEVIEKYEINESLIIMEVNDEFLS